jgi:K+-transporting ATPase KdpF subunit
LRQLQRVQSSIRLPRRTRNSIRQDDASDPDPFGRPRARERRFTRNNSMASYVLVAVVVGLVIYLFYAVINPEKF